MQPNELKIVQQLTGVDPAEIQFSDNGFWSRGYVIDDGRIVFKFKKAPDFSYQSEIDALNFINTLNLGVNLQRVGWTSPNDTYLGVYGVIGKPLTVISKNKAELNQLYNLDSIASQLASTLTILHQAKPTNVTIVPLQEEIATWQQRIYAPNNWQTLSEYLSKSELDIVDDFIRHKMPTKLTQLDENLVLTHGDLYKNNVFIDDTGKVGIIDFYRLQLLDEAADFMDIGNDLLREKILASYNADEILQQKVRIRAFIRPIYIFGAYAERRDGTMLQAFARRIHQLIELGYHDI